MEIQSLGLSLCEVEKALDLCGALPFLSSISGPVRMGIGQLELISGIGIGSLLLLASELSEGEQEQKKYDLWADHAFEYCLHGTANLLRGYGESISFLYGLGMLIVGSQGFRLKYRGEPPVQKMEMGNLMEVLKKYKYDFFPKIELGNIYNRIQPIS